ncbi:MAG: hypothetical protein ACLQU4_12845 [Limisphaerales bacterium]
MKNLPVLPVTICIHLTLAILAGSNLPGRAQTNWPNPVISEFANDPGAMEMISNILALPPPSQTVSNFSTVPSSPRGTYWDLQGKLPPSPFNPLAGLPCYVINSSNNTYIVDDRGVDMSALFQQAAEQATSVRGGYGASTLPPLDYTNSTSLWLEVPAGGVDGTNLTVIVHNTSDGQAYTMLTNQSLTDPSWVEAQLLYGTNGDSTTTQLPINGETNVFVWARSGVPVSLLAIVSQPLDQEVLEGDTVTFSVAASGSGALTYQWTCNGAIIPGATASSYTIGCVQGSDAAGYAVAVSNGVTSVSSRTAQLTVDGETGDPLLMQIIGARQDYSFKNAMTYYIDSAVELYGTTTLRGGSVIKFDWSTNSSLVVKGALVCETEPYYPAILTSVDDDSQGEWLYWVSTGDPQTATNDAAYLNLDAATSNVISNLRICYADQGVTTPVTPGALDVWDCQFFDCNYAIANLVPAFGSVDSLHNVLFARCGAAVGASTNSIEIEAEHVTADAEEFWVAGATPYKIGLTNSIIRGGFGNAAITVNQNSAINPSGRIFQRSEQGHYYLASDSLLHGAGTANISPRLQAELQHKSTYAPIAIAANAQIRGQITFFPQAARYINGPPDLGYYYDALDYTVASLILSGGSLTVLPGTAIGVRNDYIWSGGYWTVYGFYVNQGGSVTSHGTPTKPNIFTAADLVQEEPNIDFAEYQVDFSDDVGDWLPGIVSFVTDFEPGDPTSPSLDFRFSDFYLPAEDLHFCSGLSYDDVWIFSASSSVNLNLQDCSLHNGQVNIGQPDGYDFYLDQIFGSGAVTWNNTLFENVSINLDPTYYKYGYDDQGLNVDLSFQACNNLFRGGQWLHLTPIPASAGDWVFEDNLFDKVNIVEDLNQGQYQPLDYDYNGYWPLSTNALIWDSYFDPWFWWGQDSSEFQPTITSNGFTDGQHEVTLSSAPPYQSGPFGNYYMAPGTALAGAGSDTPANLGLYHYTTQTNQFKEGSEASGHMANIGLHYIAANSYGQPMDSDNDAIPDYVENWHGDGNYPAHVGVETDWQNPMTDGVNPDPSNSVYLDIDLSGDGLVGRIKEALGMNPFDASNPLTLEQVSSSDEFGVVSFELPISYNTLTNIGTLNLYFNGVDVTLEDFTNASDGNTLLEWNTTYEPPGQSYLQAQLTLSASGDDSAILTGVGTITPFYSTNVMQFFESDSMFSGSIAYLDAQLPEQNASYAIQLYDPSTTPPTLITTITDTTSDGMIEENWDLTYSDGVTIFTNNTVNAVFNVTLSDPASEAKTKVLHRLTSNEQGNGFDFVYMYTPTNGAMAHEFDDDNGNDDGVVWLGMQFVVDTLLTPQEVDGGSPNNYNSSFDNYTGEGNNTHGNGSSEGWPGYINSRSMVINSLYPCMADGATKNFFCQSHGDNNRLCDYANDTFMTATEVANLLGNHYHSRGGLNTQNPYRFVFLEGCATASAKDWRRAFGIFPLDAPNQAGLNNVGPQAYVGWAQDHAGWIGWPSDNNESQNLASAWTETLADFYGLWNQVVPLAQCIAAASTPAANMIPLPVPQNKNVTIHGQNPSTLQNYSYTYTNILTSPIYVVGHSGLTRSGVNTSLDGYYSAPVSTE